MLLLLPSEVRRDILKNLTTKDLLQCQLVNREWYTASVELLYSTVTIKTAVKSHQYTQTLSSCPQLATYLRRIDIQNVLNKTRVKGLNDQGLLTTIIQQCPNLTRINGRNPNTSFWNRICYAGSIGQLPHIQVLPLPGTDDVESYIYTILHFKNTLTHICITSTLDFGRDLKEIEAYKILLDNIKEFKNLQHLTLKYPSNKQIKCFDGLIEDCSQLREVFIELSYTKTARSIREYENLILPHLLYVHPRPDIRSFCCNWESINNQPQLEYVIHKFPRLQNLEIYCFEKQDDNIYCSPNSIVRFLHYAIIIPYFSIEFTSTEQNLLDTWTMLIDINDIYRNLVIDYYHNNIDTAAMIVRIVKTEMVIQFPLFIPLTEIHSTDTSFLSKASSKIRSLAVDRGGRFGFHFDMNTTLRFLQFCPLLQEFSLSLPLPEKLVVTGHSPTFQNLALEKLTITRINSRLDSTSKLINILSPNCPNIKQLHLIGISSSPRSQPSFYMKLDVPNTRLDLLSWDGITGPADDFKVYIYLKTNMRTELYVGSKLGLSLISTSQYNEAIGNRLLCFKIICLSLTEFRIKLNCRGSTPSNVNFNFTF